MSKDKYEQLSPVVSEHPKLRVYGRSTLKVSGEIVVTTRLEDGCKSCSAKGHCVLDRDLIQSLGLCSNIHKVSSAISYKEKFPELFSGLGCYRGKKKKEKCSQLSLMQWYCLDYARYGQSPIL